MNGMFDGATKFNQDIRDWNVTKVNSMARMFAGASKFNQDISGWDVSAVTSFTEMFKGATIFNQNLCKYAALMDEDRSVFCVFPSH
jgi:surface protein